MSSTNETLYIVIPAYNESENIEEVTKEWHKVVVKVSKTSRLVIIDDGSKDDTYNILEKLSKKYRQLTPVTKKELRPWRNHSLRLQIRYKEQCGLCVPDRQRWPDSPRRILANVGPAKELQLPVWTPTWSSRWL